MFFDKNQVISGFGRILLPVLAVFHFLIWPDFASGFGCLRHRTVPESPAPLPSPPPFPNATHH